MFLFVLTLYVFYVVFFGKDARLIEGSVVDYYKNTTFRDYKYMHWIFGNEAMHTELSTPFVKSHLLQLFHITPYIKGRVLELGFGKGFNTLTLAQMFKSDGVKFDGIDLIEEHVHHATKLATDNSLDDVVEFVNGDATVMVSSLNRKYDLIFGIESFCHMNPQDIIKSIEKVLTPGGRVVIIDGFRHNDYNNMDHDTQQLMINAEKAFRVERFSSPKEWIWAAQKYGLTLTKTIDLTSEAKPFWNMGNNFAKIIMGAVPWYFQSLIPHRVETTANFVGIRAVAEALNSGVATYGVLVFEKPKMLEFRNNWYSLKRSASVHKQRSNS